MVPSRSHRWAPAALVLVLLLSAGLVAAPAEAAIQRTLSLRASASVTGAGSIVGFSGTLTNSPGGSALRLQVKVGTTWLDTRFVNTTTAAGAYRTSVQMPKTLGKYYFRAVALSGGGRSSATSSTVTVTVLKRVYASIRANRTTVTAGQTVTFSGHVSDCLVGGSVALQRYGTTWVSVAGATLSSRCNFSRTVKPTRTASYRVYVPRHGSYAPAYSAKVRITVNGTPPAITTSSLPNGTVGTPYQQTLTRTGQSGTWSKSAGTLPPGITLSASTGVLSGTPTTGGTFAFTARFTETASGLSATRSLSITIISGPSITSGPLPNGKRGVPYSFTLTKSGGDGSWSVLHLPSGVTVDPATGVISGTAVVDGTFTVAVTFTETASGKQAHASYPVTFAPSPPPAITTTTLPDAVKGAAYSSQLAETSESGLSGTWAVTAGALPPGVALDPATGVLSGTPTAADDYVFTVSFTETAAQTKDTQSLLLHVSPAAGSPSITTTALPSGTVGTAYPTQQLQGSGAGTWSISKFALPPGLSLNGLTGQISGSPTASGDYVFQVKYQTLGGYNTKLLSIHVDPASP